MMGGGMLVMWLLPLLVLALIVLIAVIVAGGGLGLSHQTGITTGSLGREVSAFSTKVCPTCQRPMQADWRVCPYDGAQLG